MSRSPSPSPSSPASLPRAERAALETAPASDDVIGHDGASATESGSSRAHVTLDPSAEVEGLTLKAITDPVTGISQGVIESVPEAPAATKLANIARMRPTPFIIGLFVLAVLYTLRLAADFIVPIIIAIFLDFLLSPLIRKLHRRGLPNPVGAALVGALVFGTVGVTVTMLATPASEWIGRAPESLSTVASRVQRLARPLAKLQETTAKVQAAVAPADQKTQEVTVASPSILSRMTGGVASLGAAALTVVFLTFFLLASGDLFMLRVIESIPQFSDKKKAVRIARDVEDGISRYLVTVACINMGVGVATWGALWFLGMPNAMLWGVMAGVLNFIPYVGAMVTIVIIGVAALATFESTAHALAMPAAFLAINTIEANIATPIMMGRQFPLNNVAIFVGLLFWWYLWGVPGALLAVPLMVALNTCCDHIEKLKPYGAFLKR